MNASPPRKKPRVDNPSHASRVLTVSSFSDASSMPDDSSTVARTSMSKAILISNIPISHASSQTLKAFLEGSLKQHSQSMRIVDCILLTSVAYAKVEFETVNQAQVAMSRLDGIDYHGARLRVEEWTLKFQPSGHKIQLNETSSTNLASHTPNPTKPTIDDSSQSIVSVASCGVSHAASLCATRNAGPPMPPLEKLSFQATREDCAVFIRGVPPLLTSEELQAFLKKRIQLAFKELTEDIKVIACHVFHSSDQAFLEFESKRHAEYALALRNKTLQGKTLDILRWEDRTANMEIDSMNGREANFSGCNRNQHHPFAIFVSKLPEGTTEEYLKTFLTDMMQVAYKVTPTIVHCSVRLSPHNDAYVEFQTNQEVHRAINLRNRSLNGQKLAIIPWDSTFKILNHPNCNGAAISIVNEKKPFVLNRMGPITTLTCSSNLVVEPAISDTLELPTSECDTEEDPNKTTFKASVASVAVTTSLASSLGNDIVRDFSISSGHESSDSEAELPQLSKYGSSISRVDVTNQAVVNIFKRQLDALRLENQSCKEQVKDAQIGLAELADSRSERDMHRKARDEALESLQAVAVELASTRANCQRLQRENQELLAKYADCMTGNKAGLPHDPNVGAKIEASLPIPPPAGQMNGAVENELHQTNNGIEEFPLSSFPAQGDTKASSDLRLQLEDAERRFRQVTESLTQQTNMVLLTVQENFRLRTQLDGEVRQGRALEQKVQETIVDHADTAA